MRLGRRMHHVVDTKRDKTPILPPFQATSPGHEGYRQRPESGLEEKTGLL